MSESEFQAPSVEALNALLPAFEFNQVLTANGHGAVYYARQKSLGREVAIKLFSPALGATPRFMKAFASSAAAVARVNHANLIGVLDSGTIQEMPYIVMEFVPGKSLARSTYGHAIALDQSMAIIGEVCAGIAYAHEQDLVHGNLSPMNILLNRKPSPKIGNFGLDPAIHTVAEAGNQTHFSAPEVLAGEAPTRASDLYSIAAIFYELITGRPHGPAAVPVSKIVAVPSAIDRIIERATSRDPAARGTDVLAWFKSLEKAAVAASDVAAADEAAPHKPAKDKPAEDKPAKHKPTKDKSAEAKTSSRKAKASEEAAAMAANLSRALRQKLWIKIVVIVILLVAIQQVWNLRRLRQGDRKSPAPLVVVETPVNRERLPLIPTDPPVPPTEPSVPMPEPQTLVPAQETGPAPEAPLDPPPLLPDPAPSETPAQSLERLLPALLQGGRSEMPIGTVRKGDAFGLLVSQPMTWTAAALFAESHGGHLILPEMARAWRAELPAGGDGVWLGAARSGTDAFTLLNGRPWSPGQPMAGDGPYVWLDGDGSLKSADAGKTLPFLIEWSADGANPATLAAQLEATAASLTSARPVYPPDTRRVGDRYYLPVMRQVTWDEANQLAKKGGGHLMVLSDGSEFAQVAQLDPGPDLWMGGCLTGDLWAWSTGEPWGKVQWIDEGNAVADNAAMVLRCGRGLDAMLKSETATGFIIEWSRDPEPHKASPATSMISAEAVRELVDKAKALLVAAGATKEEAHRKNMHKFGWDLDAYLRSLKKSDYEIWSPEVGKLKGCVQNDRLAKDAVDGSGAKLSGYMSGRVQYHLEKQTEIDKQHAADLKTVRDSFLLKMGEIRDQAKAAGQPRIQNSAAECIAAAGDAESWVAAMSAK